MKMPQINEYARALFDLAEEAGGTEALLADIHAMSVALAENPTYVRLMDTPAVPKEERLALIGEAFVGLDPHLVSVAKLLAERRTAGSLAGLEAAFRTIYDEARGIERVEAASAVPMTEGQLARLKARLEAATGKTVIIENTVEPKLLGGVRLRYAGRQLDGTVRARLDRVEAALRNVIV